MCAGEVIILIIVQSVTYSSVVFLAYDFLSFYLSSIVFLIYFYAAIFMVDLTLLVDHCYAILSTACNLCIAK